MNLRVISNDNGTKLELTKVSDGGDRNLLLTPDTTTS
jgi:hypothetical protein